MIGWWTPRVRQVLNRTGTVLFIATLVMITALKVRYGGGSSFPEPPLVAHTAAAQQMERIAELPYAISGLAVSREGRMFIGLPSRGQPDETLVEWREGAAHPFPPLAQRVARDRIRTVAALSLDAEERLWVLDHGQHGLYPARLVAFSLANGARVHDYEMPRSIAPMGSYLSALAVSPDGRTVVIADAGFITQRPALVVYDTRQREAHRVFDGHWVTMAERYTPRVNDRRMELFGLISLRPHVNALALSPDGASVAWTAPASTRLYHMALSDLRNVRLSERERFARLKVVTQKPFSEGLLWQQPQKWLTGAPQVGALVQFSGDGSVAARIGADLLWPGALTRDAAGSVYWADLGLDRTAGRIGWRRGSSGPFAVYRIPERLLP